MSTSPVANYTPFVVATVPLNENSQETLNQIMQEKVVESGRVLKPWVAIW